MKYWLIAVSSAESTSCRTWTTSSFPFMAIPFSRAERGSYPALARAGEVVVQVGDAGGAEPAAAGLGLQRVEGLPALAQPAGDLLESEPGALAARHDAPAPLRLHQDRSAHTRPHDNEKRFHYQVTLLGSRMTARMAACRKRSTSRVPAAKRS